MRDIFKSVFDNDYPGAEEFLEKVIAPIFGEDLQILSVPEDNPLGVEPAALEKANIEEILRVATVYRTGTDPIEIFDVTLSDVTNISRSRVGIQKLIRSALFGYTHAFMLFHYRQLNGTEWRFSYVYKKDNLANSTDTKRYTYLFSRYLHARTAIDRFIALSGSKKDNQALLEAFNVEALSDDFFDEYRKQYAKFVKFVTGKEYVKEGSKFVEKQTGTPNEELYSAFRRDDKAVRDYVKKMMGRITFLHFLQRKRWMNDDLNYMLHLYENSTYKDDYLDNVLEPLFFGVLNTKPENRENLFASSGWDMTLLNEWRDIPYLNGGLFERDNDDEVRSVFPADYFSDLFEFFSEYNFTVDENDPDDAEIGVDPEMLGKIFENLLEDNKDKGAFYTPKEIVRYMCQESLVSYLKTGSDIEEARIRAFVLNPYECVDSFSKQEKNLLYNKLEGVKICDPAIGSGAFPMGLLNELVRCEESLLGEKMGRAAIKKQIIQSNIYGVDIERGAIDIARLRFWLSLVVDEDTPSPLPNLDYKIMQGNSLLESFNGMNLSHILQDEEGTFSFGISEREELKDKLKEYFSCSDHFHKSELQQEINDLVHRKQIESGATNEDFEKIDVSGNKEFFLWHTWFSDVFDSETPGFDIVIGNPPYVEAKKLKYIASKLKKHYNVYTGTTDLSIYFVELGFDLLKEGGTLSFITTNKFFNTGYGRPLRSLLLTKDISKLVNFEQVEVFEDILVSSVILEVRNSQQSSDRFTYERFYKLNKEQFKSQFIEKIGSFGYYRASYLDSNEWSFSDTTSLELKSQIELNSKELGKIEGVNIFRGVTTGYNPAFILNESQKDSLIAADTKNATVIKNLLQGRNIRRWFYNESDESLLFTRKGFPISEYKSIENYLRPFYNKLRPKEKSEEEEGRKPGTYQWYEILDNTAYYPHFERDEKVIWGLTADKWAFTLDTEQHYLPSNGYILTSDQLNTRYILGVLNSKLMHYYFGFIGVMTAGGAYTLKAATISALPFKVADPSIQMRVASIVDCILEKKEHNHDADVSELEKMIDDIVFDLYELSTAQRDMVNNSIK